MVLEFRIKPNSEVLKKSNVLEFCRKLRFWRFEDIYSSGVLKKTKPLEF